VAERSEVTAGYDPRLDSEPFGGDAALELKWDEAVVAARHDVDRDRWPGIKCAAVIEAFIQLTRCVLVHLRDQIVGTSCMK
jgi:hypothetical protein